MKTPSVCPEPLGNKEGLRWLCGKWKDIGDTAVVVSQCVCDSNEMKAAYRLDSSKVQSHGLEDKD